jgi:hypothetical protein
MVPCLFLGSYGCQKGTQNSSDGAEPNSGTDLSSENLGKNRSMNISNLPDSLNISNLPNFSTSEPGIGSHPPITGTGVNASTLPAGYDTSTTTGSSTQVPAGESVNASCETCGQDTHMKNAQGNPRPT